MVFGHSKICTYLWIKWDDSDWLLWDDGTNVLWDDL